MVKIETKTVTELTKQERRICFAMTFKTDGGMYHWLKDYRPGRVFLAKDNDTILGWGMRTDSGDVGFWVRRSARRQGIGSQLVREAKKYGKMYPKPHDVASNRLFKRTLNETT